ncbi:hypothetical protein [Streptomyces sp. NPDC058623]
MGPGHRAGTQLVKVRQVTSNGGGWGILYEGYVKIEDTTFPTSFVNAHL